MLSKIGAEIADKGYVLLRKVAPDLSTEELADTLGEPIAPWDGGLVQKLVPTAEATPNTYSGIYGLDRFPFHTDLAHWCNPPRYLLLRCLVGYSDVPTLLVDGETLKGAISQDMMARAIFKQRRPLNGKLSLLRLSETDEAGRDLLRWDEVFLKPASKIGDIVDFQIREWLANCQPISIGLANKHDTIIIDNWRMLHARAPIPAGRENRALERVYLRKLN
jgi:L-asparagine oxygenase